MKTDVYAPLLINPRWIRLNRAENLTEKQKLKSAELLQYDPKSIISYLLKDDLRQP